MQKKKTWEKVEDEVVELIRNECSEECTLEHIGGTKSRKPDIIIRLKRTNKDFALEVKHIAKGTEVQFGQFTLRLDNENKRFNLSRWNRFKPNDITYKILDKISENYDYYASCDKDGIVIDISSEILYNWLDLFCQSKGIEYINVDVENFIKRSDVRDCINLQAKVQLRDSGSHNVAKCRRREVSEYIKENYNVKCFDMESKTMLVYSDENLHEEKFFLNGRKYRMSFVKDGIYRVKRSSLTSNPAVVLYASLKDDVETETIEEFKQYLKNCA